MKFRKHSPLFCCCRRPEDEEAADSAQYRNIPQSRTSITAAGAISQDAAAVVVDENNVMEYMNIPSKQPERSSVTCHPFDKVTQYDWKTCIV